MDSMKGYENRKLWHCQFMGTRINFNPDCISLCHEAQVGDRILMDVEQLTPERYFEAISRIIDDTNMDPSYPCRSCTKCTESAFRLKKINFVTICTSRYCNSKCIYCTEHFGAENSGYDPVPYLEMFHQRELFAPNCYFDWGGGEPTLNPYYEKTVNWVHQRGYYQRFNTNGIIFSQMTYEALKEGKGNVRISVDSGTRETYRRVKGTDNFESVWDSIARYCSVSDDVYIKYNICNYNSERSDLDSFIERCRSCSVKNVIVDGEINSYQPASNAGPFYFTERELDAARYLEKEAKSAGMNVEIGWYAFSVRAEYDEAGRLKLPERYHDNIDAEIISSGVKVRTFATVDQLVERISEMPQIPLVIWGNASIADKVRYIMQQRGLQVRCLIDENNNLHYPDSWRYAFRKIISAINRKAVRIFPSLSRIDLPSALCKLIDQYGNVHLVLAGGYWKEMLRRINRKKLMIDGFVYYMHDEHFQGFGE